MLRTNIKQLRLQAELTQEELAEAVGAVRQTIAYLEKGEYMPSLALSWRIANYFHKTIEDVFYLSE